MCISEARPKLTFVAKCVVNFSVCQNDVFSRCFLGWVDLKTRV